MLIRNQVQEDMDLHAETSRATQSLIMADIDIALLGKSSS